MKPISETEKIKEMAWCHKHGVTIYPVPVDGSAGVARPKCHIEIDNLGKTYQLQGEYKQDWHLFERIINEYKRIYNKNQ